MTIVAGIDIGAGTAKVVILGDRQILSYSILPTGHNSIQSARDATEQALKKSGILLGDLVWVVATGYSRNLVTFANKATSEIMCHAKGANFLIPQTRTVIDIGCQDSKVISLNERGMVTNFSMNDKCAAGTGRFIEVMAHALELRIEDVGSVALTSDDCCDISSTCTVFAETEIICQRAQGRTREDLIAGILKSISKRIRIIASGIEVAKEVVFTGGTAKNIGMKRALEEEFGVDILVPEEPQIVGALGAALFAYDETTI